jgi:hypothetical protein
VSQQQLAERRVAAYATGSHHKRAHTPEKREHKQGESSQHTLHAREAACRDSIRYTRESSQPTLYPTRYTLDGGGPSFAHVLPPLIVLPKRRKLVGKAEGIDNPDHLLPPPPPPISLCSLLPLLVYVYTCSPPSSPISVCIDLMRCVCIDELAQRHPLELVLYIPVHASKRVVKIFQLTYECVCMYVRVCVCVCVRVCDTCSYAYM